MTLLNQTPQTGIPTDTTPGFPTTYTNADGSAINSGGSAETLATPAPTAVADPASQATRTTVPATSSSNNGASANARYPITPITPDPLLPTYPAV